MDLYLRHKKCWIWLIFCLLQMLTDGLWIIVMFLLDSHSDGTHSHPLLRHISTNLMKKQFSDDPRMSTFYFEVNTLFEYH